MNEEHDLQPLEVIPVKTYQTTMWGQIAGGLGTGSRNPFAGDPAEEAHHRVIAQHRAWMESMPHELPNPAIPFRIGVYIRFFNQTKHENYLEFHKAEFEQTIALCPQWTLVDFYIDYGQSAPNMENAPEWRRLMDDCFEGKVNLIVTQKVSNVSRKSEEITLYARILASQASPIGIYFVNENIFTLASYYLEDLHERSFLPPNWKLLPDDEDEEPRRLYD